MVGARATFVDHVRPDGVVVRWESRRHRKHQKPAAGSTWWAPKARGWWIAVLFAIGSLLFALGSVPGYASAAGARGDSVTYFVGSLFFTAASFLSYREAVDAAPPAANPAHRRFFTYQPGRIDWWATAIQLAGTVYFNVSTGVAMADNLSAQAAHQHVWRPDGIGSACFLVSSVLAWYEACHGWAAWRPRSWSWWITLANLIGSIAFGISAVAGYVNPDAVRYTRLTYDEALAAGVRIMDTSAFVLANEQCLTMHVFDVAAAGVMRQICEGAELGTRISVKPS